MMAGPKPCHHFYNRDTLPLDSSEAGKVSFAKTVAREMVAAKTHRILGISKALPLKNSKALFIRYQIAPMAMSTCSVTKAA